MIYSKETKNWAYSIVNNFAKLDKIDKKYQIDLQRIPESLLGILSSMIIEDNPGLGSECTGSDNPHFEHAMLPDLLNFLANTNNAIWQKQFTESWKKGIINYLTESLEEIITHELDEFNLNHAEEAAKLGKFTRINS
jgi:hypothetical protein